MFNDLYKSMLKENTEKREFAGVSIEGLSKDLDIATEDLNSATKEYGNLLINQERVENLMKISKNLTQEQISNENFVKLQHLNMVMILESLGCQDNISQESELFRNIGKAASNVWEVIKKTIIKILEYIKNVAFKVFDIIKKFLGLNRKMSAETESRIRKSAPILNQLFKGGADDLEAMIKGKTGAPDKTDMRRVRTLADYAQNGLYWLVDNTLIEGPGWGFDINYTQSQKLKDLLNDVFHEDNRSNSSQIKENVIRTDISYDYIRQALRYKNNLKGLTTFTMNGSLRSLRNDSGNHIVGGYTTLVDKVVDDITKNNYILTSVDNWKMKLNSKNHDALNLSGEMELSIYVLVDKPESNRDNLRYANSVLERKDYSTKVNSYYGGMAGKSRLNRTPDSDISDYLKAVMDEYREFLEKAEKLSEEFAYDFHRRLKTITDSVNKAFPNGDAGSLAGNNPAGLYNLVFHIGTNIINGNSNLLKSVASTYNENMMILKDVLTKVEELQDSLAAMSEEFKLNEYTTNDK